MLELFCLGNGFFQGTTAISNFSFVTKTLNVDDCIIFDEYQQHKHAILCLKCRDA